MSQEIDDLDRVWMKAEVSYMMKMESMFHSNSGASALRAEEKNQTNIFFNGFCLCEFHLLQCSAIELYGVNHQATAQRQVTEFIFNMFASELLKQLMISWLFVKHFIIWVFCHKVKA